MFPAYLPAYVPEKTLPAFGIRIIYYFHDAGMPIYFLAGFAKNEKADLSSGERAQLRKLVDLLLAERGGR